MSNNTAEKIKEEIGIALRIFMGEGFAESVGFGEKDGQWFAELYEPNGEVGATHNFTITVNEEPEN